MLTAALNIMHKHYVNFETPGPQDVFDYGIGPLWRKGIDGAGTTIAVLEGWDFPGIAKQVAAFDKPWGLPNPKMCRRLCRRLCRWCPAGVLLAASGCGQRDTRVVAPARC